DRLKGPQPALEGVEGRRADEATRVRVGAGRAAGACRARRRGRRRLTRVADPVLIRVELVRVGERTVVAGVSDRVVVAVLLVGVRDLWAVVARVAEAVAVPVGLLRVGYQRAVVDECGAARVIGHEDETTRLAGGIVDEPDRPAAVAAIVPHPDVRHEGVAVGEPPGD